MDNSEQNTNMSPNGDLNTVAETTVSEGAWKPNSTPVNGAVQATATIEKPTKPLRPLTRRQQAFVRQLVENPTISATKAYMAAYQPKTASTAPVEASRTLNKPNVMAELAKYDGTAQLVLVEAMQASKKVYKFNPRTEEYEMVGQEPDHAIRLRAADSLLDRVHGKATQRVEAQSTAVTLNVDLTGQLGA